MWTQLRGRRSRDLGGPVRCRVSFTAGCEARGRPYFMSPVWNSIVHDISQNPDGVEFLEIQIQYVVVESRARVYSAVHAAHMVACLCSKTTARRYGSVKAQGSQYMQNPDKTELACNFFQQARQGRTADAGTGVRARSASHRFAPFSHSPFPTRSLAHVWSLCTQFKGQPAPPLLLMKQTSRQVG